MKKSEVSPTVSYTILDISEEDKASTVDLAGWVLDSCTVGWDSVRLSALAEA